MRSEEQEACQIEGPRLINELAARRGAGGGDGAKPTPRIGEFCQPKRLLAVRPGRFVSGGAVARQLVEQRARLIV
jgi:hypothetical protein